ncbi:MAG: GNAT family N-acetyltransferase [Clostridia bacterium]|nr:GNAT family N-acetyltransferase [Clostridia bacterium]
MILAVDETNLSQAAAIHAISWKESHRSFCTPDFVAEHTPERQREYIRRKMNCASRFFLLMEDGPAGIVSVRGNLIEDLYVLPDRQRRGCGTKLLRFAMEQCAGIPVLWILENNADAKRLYHKMGFRETGRIRTAARGLDEIELCCG